MQNNNKNLHANNCNLQAKVSNEISDLNTGMNYLLSLNYLKPNWDNFITNYLQIYYIGIL